MSEQTRLIPKVPPIEKPESKVVENPMPPPPKDGSLATPMAVPDSTASTKVSPNSVTGISISNADPVIVIPDVKIATSEAKPAVPEVRTTVPKSITQVPDGSELYNEANNSITLFQGGTYASFFITFLLAGFAAVAVFRKALSASVKRFSISAKVLSLAFIVIAFFGAFGTYVYSGFLNGGDTSFPLIIPVLSWIFVGPLIAIALNSLLTRENEPAGKKLLFDAFIYIVIFSCAIASQIPSLGEDEPLFFSFLAVFFFIFPIVRFSKSLKMSKAFHPEMQEMFIQILVCSLLFLPILLPSLLFVNSLNIVTDDLALLLLNVVTFVFVLIAGLLMIISIDYITQGIGPDQLASAKPDIPTAPVNPKSDGPSTPPAPPTKESIKPVYRSEPSVPATVEPKVSAPKEPAEPKPPAAPVETIATDMPSDFPEQTLNYEDIFEESSDLLESDLEKHDSTVINFNIAKSSTVESQENDSEDSASKESNLRPSDTKSKSGNKGKSSQVPKAPQSPNTSKSIDPKSRIKPPERPKKRF